MFRKILRFFRARPADVEDILRYPDGKRIYREFHELRRDHMDQDALKVINRLNRHGYRSYLVGGCVRDMILGRRPKDFDVVTSATPAQIRKAFTNSRAIGRRFKIVHVVFQGGKIIEVSTFRSLPQHRLDREEADDYMLKRDNQFGSAREDAARRDFTINALFFDARNESIIDYVGGYEDIKEGRIQVIGDADISFKEDPVRMLRAAKFSALLGFTMPPNLLKAIRRNRTEILKSSTARMLEEYNKIFRTGKASQIFQAFAESGLLKTLMPEAWSASDLSRGRPFVDSSIGKRLQVADRMLTEREDLTTTLFLALLMADLVKDVFHNNVRGNVIDYVKGGLNTLCRRLQLPGKDQDRLLQIFMSQPRFWQKGGEGRRGRSRFNPELFREKIFFYESFMLFKIHALAEGDEESIQKSMFWEIGPRMRPPESHKLVTLFPGSRQRRPRPEGDRDQNRGDRGDRGERGDRERGGRGRRGRGRGRSERPPATILAEEDPELEESSRPDEYEAPPGERTEPPPESEQEEEGEAARRNASTAPD